MPKKIAGRYLVHEEIGRGGMGVVYRAQDEKFDAEVAVKVLSAKHANEDAAERLKREAKLGHLLGKQEGLVRALDWGQLKNGSYYLVIDYVNGARDLNLTEGSLIQRVTRVYEAANLVSKAHAAGVLHRDVKPANFLIDRDERLHLTDFGIAKRIDEIDADDGPIPDSASTVVAEFSGSAGLTGANVGLGTPYFMPPEQFENAASVDVRADVYALGVMLFQALTGAYPFPGKTPAEVYGGVMKTRYGTLPTPSVRKHLRTIPAAIDRIVHRALAPLREERYPTVGALVAALDEANWQAGLAGVSPLVGGSHDGATVAFPLTGGGTRAPQPLHSTQNAGPSDAATQAGEAAPEEEPTESANRCPGCGHEPLRSDLCPKCGADVIVLRTQTRLQSKQLREQREQAAQEQANRRRVSGASLDYGGLQIPKIAWFLIGAMVITGIVLNVDWSSSPNPDAKTETQTAPPSDPEAPSSEDLVDAEELADPSDLGSRDAQDYELFLGVHQAWLKWNSYDTVEDPKAEVLIEVPELEDAFESYRLRIIEDQLETRCRTPRYTFLCRDDEEPEIRERVAR